MANLFRLVMALALVFIAGASHALLPVESSWYFSSPSLGTFGSPEAVCQSAVYKQYQASAQYPFYAAPMNGAGTSATCQFQCPGFVCSGASVTKLSSCPAGSTPSGSECACAADRDEVGGQCVPKCAADETRIDDVCRKNNPCGPGNHEEGGQCVPDNCKPDEVRVNGLCVKEPGCPPGQTRVNGQCKPDNCPKGKPAGGYDMDSDGVQYVCEQWAADSCMVRVTPSTSVSWTDADGVRHTSYYGQGVFTGAKCSGGGTGGGDNGGTGGGDNGGDGDGGNGGDGNGGDGGDGTGNGGTGNGGTGDGPTPNPNPPSPPSPVPPDPDTGKCPAGTQRHSDGNCYAPTKPPETPNSDGRCPEGSVKVGQSCVYPSPPGKPVPDGGTPENPHPGGGSGGGDGDGDGDGDGESGWAGDCMAGFACEGDAIQCAIAKEQHRRACKLFDEKSTESELYNKEKGKEGAQTEDLPGNRTESLQGRISTVDALGAGQCISDLTVVVVGKSVTLPMSRICPTLAIIGNIMVAISFLAAIRIVGRG